MNASVHVEGQLKNALRNVWYKFGINWWFYGRNPQDQMEYETCNGIGKKLQKTETEIVDRIYIST